MLRYVEIRRGQQQQEKIDRSRSWEERMLANLRQDQPESESSNFRQDKPEKSESLSSWEERMLAGLSSLRKDPPAESRLETSTSWEDRMLVREAGGRLQVGGRRNEKDEEQREKEVIFL